eukprot:scaffold31709_cov118-Isochrysis_galbana.AAC.1
MIVGSRLGVRPGRRVSGVALLAPRTQEGRNRLSPPKTDYSPALGRPSLARTPCQAIARGLGGRVCRRLRRTPARRRKSRRNTRPPPLQPKNRRATVDTICDILLKLSTAADG